MPSNSEFLTRLINAAFGLVLPPMTGKPGSIPFNTAYPFPEFSSSHRTGSGKFFCEGCSVGRIGLYFDAACTSGEFQREDGKTTRKNRASTPQTTKGRSRRLGNLFVSQRQCVGLSLGRLCTYSCLAHATPGTDTFHPLKDDLHVFGGVRQKAVESVLVERDEDDADLRDQLLFKELERMGVYGSERLPNDRGGAGILYLGMLSCKSGKEKIQSHCVGYEARGSISKQKDRQNEQAHLAPKLCLNNRKIQLCILSGICRHIIQGHIDLHFHCSLERLCWLQPECKQA